MGTVHRGRCKRMNFLEKNFKYVEMDFEDFVEMASLQRQQKQNGENSNLEKTIDEQQQQQQKSLPSNSCEEWLYLRSLATDPRKDVSDIGVGFPELTTDFSSPPY